MRGTLPPALLAARLCAACGGDSTPDDSDDTNGSYSGAACVMSFFDP